MVINESYFHFSIIFLMPVENMLARPCATRREFDTPELGVLPCPCSGGLEGALRTTSRVLGVSRLWPSWAIPSDASPHLCLMPGAVFIWAVRPGLSSAVLVLVSGPVPPTALLSTLCACVVGSLSPGGWSTSPMEIG